MSTLMELSRGEFDCNQITEMERTILDALKWRMNPPTTQSFIERLCRLLPTTDTTAVKNIYQRALFFAELSVFDYAFVPEERYLVAVACLLNAIEGTEHGALNDSTKMGQEFLVKLATTVEYAELDKKFLDCAQDRLWFLYACSAQLQQDEIVAQQEGTLNKQEHQRHGRWFKPRRQHPAVVL